ncbi:MAG: ATP-binding protein [Chloroflexi bacterium]|nr:ATP-binding protein [Chloroflexota bacterium]
MRIGGLVRTLGFQLALSMSVLIVAVGALVVWQVDGLLRDNELDHFSEELLQAQGQLAQYLATDRELSVTGASVLANHPGIGEAIATRDVVTILQVGTDYYTRTGTPLQGAPGLQIYDASGNLILRIHDPLRGRQRVVPSEIREVFATGVPLGVMRADELLGPAIVGIAPVVGSGGGIVGAVEVLTGIDRGYIRDRQRLLGFELALVTEDGVTAAQDDEHLTLITSGMARQATDSGVTLIEVGGEPYLSAFLPLDSLDGAPVADIYIGVDESEVLAGVDEVRMAALQATAIGGILAVVLAVGLAFVTIRPIRELVEAARRIQANDLDAPVETNGPSEVLDLADALDDLRLAVRQTREAMLSVNRDLSSRFDASTASLTEATQELAVMLGVLRALSSDAPGGLSGVVEQLTAPEWADGALIALANDAGELSLAASAGLMPVGRSALLEAISRGVRGQRLETGIVVADTSVIPETTILRSYEIGGFAAQAMVEPDGVTGVLIVSSRRALRLTPSRTELLRSVTREVQAMIERTELAGEVEENRRIAESVLREMSDGVLVIDHNDRCLVANPAAVRLLGTPRPQLVGRTAGEVLPLGGEAIETLRRRAADPERTPVAPLLTEARGRRLAISAGPFVDADPDRAGMMVLMRDLSAEADAERVKQDFVSMVGHELRTPLTLIRTTVDLLNEGDAGGLNDTQARIVEVLRSNTDRLMSLINDLLDMSAIDSGRMEIQPGDMDLVEIVTDAVEEARPAAETKDHHILLHSPGVAAVWADRRRVGQVVSNLISNAVKYTPPGGTIEVSVDVDEPWAQVSVRDTGIGISADDQRELFERFYRTSAGRRITGGTGLGLAIARSLIELHGGQIWVDSDGESGSTFAFTLPTRPI